MIIWINGPFGIGKTQTAFELHRRIDNSFVYDPEQIGYFTAKMVPKYSAKSDFQEYKIWRSYNRDFLDYIDQKDSVIIVPMTLVNSQYYDEIIVPLKNNHLIHHFTLMAKKETIQKRLRKRFDGNTWNYHQIDRCLTGLADNRFVEYIDTDSNDLHNVVDYIIKKCKVNATIDNRTKMKKSIDRLVTTIQHIRM